MEYFDGDILENDAGERVQLIQGQWTPLGKKQAIVDEDVPQLEAPPEHDPFKPDRNFSFNPLSEDFLGLGLPGGSALDSLAAFPMLGEAGGIEAIGNAIGGARVAAGAAPRAGQIVGAGVRGVDQAAGSLLDRIPFMRTPGTGQAAAVADEAAEPLDSVMARLRAAAESAPASTRLTAASDAARGAEPLSSRLGIHVPEAGSLESSGSALKDYATAIGEKIPWVGGNVAAGVEGRTAANMAARVLQNMGEAGTAGPRVREGLLTSKELTSRLGLPEDALTQAQRLTLDLPAAQADELSTTLQGLRMAEDTRAGVGGPGFEALRAGTQAVKNAYTGRIMDDFFGPAAAQMRNVAPDPRIISQFTRAAGDDIGRALTEHFPDDIVRLAPEDSFTEVLGLVTKDKAAPALRILEDVGAVTKGADGQLQDVAAMPLDRYTQMRSELVKLADSPDEIVSRIARQLEQRVDAAAYRGMLPEGKEALSNARYRYRIGKRLEKPGVIKEGTIDPAAFARSWTRGESTGMRQFNELATLSDTVREVTAKKAHAGSTLERGISEVGGGVVEKLVRSVVPGL